MRGRGAWATDVGPGGPRLSRARPEDEDPRAGAALTAGGPRAGARRGAGPGAGWGRRKRARGAGALLEGQGDRRAKGRRGGRAGGRGSGPGHGARGAPGRGAGQGRGVPSRRGGHGRRGFGVRGPPPTPPRHGLQGRDRPDPTRRPRPREGRARHLPPPPRRPQARSALTSSVHGSDPDGHFHFGVPHPAAAEALARLPSAAATGQLFGADQAGGGYGREGRGRGGACGGAGPTRGSRRRPRCMTGLVVPIGGRGQSCIGPVRFPLWSL